MSLCPTSSRHEDAPPPAVQLYLDAMGRDATVAFLLAFGGGSVYLPAKVTDRSRVATVVGYMAAASLTSALGCGHVRPPLAKRWIAHQLAANGASRSEIARRLHLSNEAVRCYFVAPGRRATKKLSAP